jgi:hypothetical protein
MEDVRYPGVAMAAIGVENSFRHHLIEIMIHGVNPRRSRKLEAFFAQAVILTGLTVVKNCDELFTAMTTMKFGRLWRLGPDCHEAVVL